MQEQVFLGINMGETEEITVECSPAGSLQLIDRFGGYDFLFVSFSPKNGPAGNFLQGRLFAIKFFHPRTIITEYSRCVYGTGFFGAQEEFQQWESGSLQQQWEWH